MVPKEKTQNDLSSFGSRKPTQRATDNARYDTQKLGKQHCFNEGVGRLGHFGTAETGGPLAYGGAAETKQQLRCGVALGVCVGMRFARK